jgi:hypothetical protein
VSDDKLRLENPLKQAVKSRAAQTCRAEFVVSRRFAWYYSRTLSGAWRGGVT